MAENHIKKPDKTILSGFFFVKTIII